MSCADLSPHPFATNPDRIMIQSPTCWAPTRLLKGDSQEVQMAAAQPEGKTLPFRRPSRLTFDSLSKESLHPLPLLFALFCCGSLRMAGKNGPGRFDSSTAMSLAAFFPPEFDKFHSTR